MKYFLIAGERSGDLHASNLMKALLQSDSAASFRYFGGDHMAEVNGSPIVHYREMAFMGFWEVLQNLGTIRQFLHVAKKEILSFQPDALVLVDYGGFNLKVASFAKSRGIKVHYYILPKIWAWNQKRAFKLKESVDYMYSILPFEPEFFRKFGVEHIKYVGNPVVEAVDGHKVNTNFLSKHSLAKEKKLIAILPGSRNQELKHTVPVLREVIVRNPQFNFCIAAIDTVKTNYYEVFKDLGNVQLIFNETYDLLANSDGAIVTSGTATLETALWKVPQVVIYKSSWLSYLIAKMVIKVKYISLVNLITNSQCVSELIQHNCSPKRLNIELRQILNKPTDYSNLAEAIGSRSASQITARTILKTFDT